MKKLLVILAMIGILFTLSSCRNRCTCTVIDGFGEEMSTVAWTKMDCYDYEKMLKEWNNNVIRCE